MGAAGIGDGVRKSEGIVGGQGECAAEVYGIAGLAGNIDGGSAGAHAGDRGIEPMHIADEKLSSIRRRHGYADGEVVGMGRVAGIGTGPIAGEGAGLAEGVCPAHGAGAGAAVAATGIETMYGGTCVFGAREV